MYTLETERMPISEVGFPATGTPADRLRFVVNYAVLAPSGHNSQPWKFLLAPDRIYLLADRSRALAVSDPDGREMVISCGAALHNLRVALRYFGYDADITLCPQLENREILAELVHGSPAELTPDDCRVFHAIPRRHTNRLSFKDLRIPESVLDSLRAAAAREGCRLTVFNDPQARGALCDLVAQADRYQLADAAFRRELSLWVRESDRHKPVSVPGTALDLSRIISHPDPAGARSFDVGALYAARERQLAAGATVLAVISSPGDTPIDWMRSGQALEQILLIGCDDGVSASFLNPPLQVQHLRPQVAGLLEQGSCPQVILRMGYGPETHLTPRRPAYEVLQEIDAPLLPGPAPMHSGAAGATAVVAEHKSRRDAGTPASPDLPVNPGA